MEKQINIPIKQQTVSYVTLFDPTPKYVNKIHQALDDETFIFIFLTGDYIDAIKYDWSKELIKSIHICKPYYIGNADNYQKAAYQIVKMALEV